MQRPHGIRIRTRRNDRLLSVDAPRGPRAAETLPSPPPQPATPSAPVLLGAAILAAIAGCRPATKPDFNSAEPAARNEAIVLAAATQDQRSVPDLVRMLDSDDPATRLLAIRTLERLTGETFGYDHTMARPARAAAIGKWQHYVASTAAENKR